MKRVEHAKIDNLGQDLLRAARLYNEICVTKFQRFEPEFTVAHTRLFPHLDLSEGTRPSDLAARTGISKQNLNHLLNDLEQMGYLSRCPDPNDGRARLVKVTESGGEAMVRGLKVFKELEQELAEKMDSEQLQQLKSALREVVGLLEGY
jgi:DNA-binding MarR family transcriptional regulator